MNCQLRRGRSRKKLAPPLSSISPCNLKLFGIVFKFYAVILIISPIVRDSRLNNSFLHCSSKFFHLLCLMEHIDVTLKWYKDLIPSVRDFLEDVFVGIVAD